LESNVKRILRMNSATVAITALACTLLSAPAVSLADGAALAGKYNCQSCHTVDKKIVGPSFKDVAAKYAGDSGALAKLEQKIKSGGSGVWGPIPMPPNNIPDADLKALTEWVLAAK
jgi:cytochrome c